MNYDFFFKVLWQTRKYIPFLDRELGVCFISEDHKEMPPTDRQIELLDSLDNFPSSMITQLNDWARKYYVASIMNWGITADELADEIGFEIDEANIQNHYQINEVLIPRIENYQSNYIFLSGECDWEEEHGIEFLLKNGSIVHCTAQEGLAMNEEWDDYLFR